LANNQLVRASVNLLTYTFLLSFTFYSIN